MTEDGLPPVIEAAQALPQPTVREIIAAIDSEAKTVTWCVAPAQDGSGGTMRRVPWELWIEETATWLRFDGSFAQFALRGERRFNGLDRTRLHSACRRWQKRKEGRHK